MNPVSGGGLIGVKSSVVRHPAVIGAGAAALAALLALNVAAFIGGMATPLLLSGVIIADMLVIGGGVIFAAREVLTAGERMQATQAQLGAIVDSAMDAIITVDASQKIVLFNRAAEKIFRCRREEALNAALDHFIPQRFRPAHRGHIEDFGRTGVTNRRMGDVTILWALRADGEEFPIEASISQAREGEQRYYTVILRDITLRKRYEDELKRQQQELRELSARVLEAREEEKTRIARELHDELGQMLTALKMDLSWMRERLPDAQVARKAAEMSAMLDQTVTATRRISADLRPLMLDDLGLADAAQWLVEDFARRSGIDCRIELPAPGALDGLAKPLSTALYRAVRAPPRNFRRGKRCARASPSGRASVAWRRPRAQCPCRHPPPRSAARRPPG